MIKSINPQEAKRLIDEEGAILIDIRETDEYKCEHVEGARLMPLSVFSLLPPSPDRDRTAIFFCGSGIRTQGCTSLLENHGFAKTYCIEGGLLGWKKSGLPTVSKKTPIPMQRQIMIAAGSLVFILSLIALFIPFVTWLTLFIAANLIFSGASGICMMAKLLMLMPWNRK